MTSNVEFETKHETKSFALSIEDDMTSAPFIILGTAALPLFRILLGDLPEFAIFYYFKKYPLAYLFEPTFLFYKIKNHTWAYLFEHASLFHEIKKIPNGMSL